MHYHTTKLIKSRFHFHNMVIVRFEEVSKYYRKSRFGNEFVVALDNVSFEIDGGIVGLNGPNGAGKTTAIRLMLRLIEPTKGRVVTNFSPYDVGYIPQEAHPDEFLTLYENMVLILRLHGLSKDKSRTVARELVTKFDLMSHADKPAFKLSEGLKRKSIVLPILFGLEKRCYVLDEPFEYLDYETRMAVISRLRELKVSGAAVVLSTHNLYEAKNILDKAIILKNKLVKIVEENEISRLEEFLIAS